MMAMIEKAAVLPFIFGGVIGSTFGSMVAVTMWMFDSLEVSEAVETAKSLTASGGRRTYVRKGRVRHEGYGLRIVEVRI